MQLRFYGISLDEPQSHPCRTPVLFLASLGVKVYFFEWKCFPGRLLALTLLMSHGVLIILLAILYVWL